MSERAPADEAADARATAPNVNGLVRQPGQAAPPDARVAHAPTTAPSRSWSASKEERLAVVDKM